MEEKILKKKLKIITVLIILFLVLTAGYLLFQWQQNKPSPATADEDFSDWKTYISMPNNYSIQYPANWHVYDYENAIYIQQEEQTDPCDKGCAPGPYAGALKIEVKTIDENKSIDEATDDYIKTKNFVENPSDYFIKTPMTIGGHEGMKIISTCEGLGCGVPEWLVSGGDKLYIFDSQLSYTEIFDKIISTFEAPAIIPL